MQSGDGWVSPPTQVSVLPKAFSSNFTLAVYRIKWPKAFRSKAIPLQRTPNICTQLSGLLPPWISCFGGRWDQMTSGSRSNATTL